MVAAAAGIGLPHRGDIPLPDGDAVVIREPVDEGVKGGPHAVVVVPGGKVALQVIGLQADKVVRILLQPGPHHHAVVALQAALGDVVQGQQHHHAVVPLRGAHTVGVPQIHGVVHDVHAAGGVHHVHQDLGSGLGKQGGVHGVDVLHGAVRQHPCVVICIRIGPHDGSGRLAGGIRPLGLPDGRPGHDGQNQHRHRHSPFLKKLHKRMSSLPLSPVGERGQGKPSGFSRLICLRQIKKISIIFGRACTCRKFPDPCAPGAHTPVTGVTGGGGGRGGARSPSKSPPQLQQLLLQLALDAARGVAKSALLRFRLTAKTAPAPLLRLSPSDPLRWAPTGAPGAGPTELSAAIQLRSSSSFCFSSPSMRPSSCLSGLALLGALPLDVHHLIQGGDQLLVGVLAASRCPRCSAPPPWRSPRCPSSACRRSSSAGRWSPR